MLQLNAERAVPVAEGSYRWRGELRLWDNEALIGWRTRQRRTLLMAFTCLLCKHAGSHRSSS